ncbi:anthrax toxin lethal factor-related metalloendopeptidase [Paenibacillus sp. KN14-4R]|uniref:anthrax toxin lethal factor-related metalloendopeptidase n=1 Tax=Paenibacillus sp. KN14-4R TaxID=3445773 RepID=UPI003FA05CDC
MKRVIVAACAAIVLLSSVTAIKPVNAQSDAFALVNDIVTLPTDKYDTKEADNMKERLAKIPATLLQGLKDKSVKIKLVNGKITNEPELAQYKGVTPRGWEQTGLTWDDVPGVSTNNVIVRIGFSNKHKGHNSQNLELHETLHAVDRMALGEVSASKEFNNIFKKEADINYKGDGYVSVYPTEYFAETATLYLYSKATRESLQKDMPLTYDFLDKLFNK